MATIREIETAIANARSAGDRNAVVSLTALLERARSDGAAQGEMGWGEVAGRAVMNLPSSAGQYISDLTSAVTQPVETLQAIGDLGAGALREGARSVLPTPVFNALDSIGSQEAANRASDTATAVGRRYSDRYGSMEGFKRAIAEDPVGVAADLSLPVTGAGGVVAQAPSIAGRAGRIIQSVGRNLDPVSAVANSISGVGAGARAMVGTMTGTGDEPLREGFNAARAGGRQSQAFYDNMRGLVPQERVVREALDAVDNIRAQRNRDYKVNIQSTRNPQGTRGLPATSNGPPQPGGLIRVANELATAIDDMVESGNWTGGNKSENVARTMINDIMSWSRTPSAHTAKGLDGLKKRIRSRYKQLGPGVDDDQAQANRLIELVEEGLKREISTMDPRYAETMRQYAEASDLLRQMGQSLSLSPTASLDTQLRKLQSVMRNNVQTNYGQRINLARELERAGADTLMPSLAGQAVNQLAPRGLARVGAPTAAGMAALGGYLTNPMMMAALVPAGVSAAMSSPRLMGEVAGLLGGGARQVDRVADAAPQTVRDAARIGAGRSGRYVAQEVGGITNEADAMLEDAQGNVYDRKGRLIRRGQQ